MQSTMLRLDALLRRRRRLVLIAWALILLAALPFAARQSEDLSSGGFGVPGSQSAQVDVGAGEVPRRPARAARGGARAAAGAPPGQQLRAALDRVAAAAGDGRRRSR